MEIKLTGEQSDFIKNNFCCKATNYDATTETFDDMYFTFQVFQQNSENKGSCIFDVKSISELSKSDFLEILSIILRS